MRQLSSRDEYTEIRTPKILQEIHVLQRSALCLFDPDTGEWDNTNLIADTTVVWASEWLHHYELWHVTGEWHGHRLVEQMKRAHVVKLLEPLTDRPSARNNRLRMLRMLLNHAIEVGWRSDNPATAIKKMRTGSQGFHTWTEDELSAFFAHHEVGSTAHTAVTLMLYTACSRADAVRLGWQNVSGDRIQYRRKKTERFSEVVVDIPIHPELQRVLGTLPKTQMTFLETIGGRSRSTNGLGTAMRKWCNAANLPGSAAHGLRKACATRLAEAGASEREIMAWTGHTSPQMVQIYAGKARRGLMADQGFAKMRQNETGSKSDEPKDKGSTG